MGAKRSGGPSAPGNSDEAPGRLGVDDRGNVTWEWAAKEDLLADDPLGDAARLHVLLDPNLKVADDPTDPMNPAHENPKGLKKGYNPYNSGALVKRRWRRKKDLRKLSKWIELRRKLAEKKDEE
jgi:hypothetical protein